MIEAFKDFEKLGSLLTSMLTSKTTKLEFIFTARFKAIMPAKPTSFCEIFNFRSLLLSGRISAMVMAPV
jgi:hypothetical protein